MTAPARPTEPAERVMDGRAIVGETVYIRATVARPPFAIGPDWVSLSVVEGHVLMVPPATVLTRKELVAAIRRSET